MRIVFMGTPAFAVPSLRALVEGGYEVVGVVTNPDKAVGRHGHTLVPSPVKQYAVSQGLPVLQPDRLKDESFVAALRSWQADVQVVVAFRLLPEVVWAMPPMGTFNLHAALLPNYRGAAPIQWAIINGEKETGLTTFLIDRDVDTGRILLQVRVPIADDDDAGTLHDRLMECGAQLVRETLDGLQKGTITPVDQHLWPAPAALRPAPKIFRDTCRIDWRQSAEQVRNLLRGLSPSPGAWTLITAPDDRPCDAPADRPSDAPSEQGGGEILKIYKAALSDYAESAAPGTLLCMDGHLIARCGDGWITLIEVQPAGKKRMSGEDFLRGRGCRYVL